MAISTFPPAAASQLLSFKAPSGVSSVSIDSGVYNVVGTDVLAFPVTVGDQTIASDTQVLDLTSPATTIEFPKAFDGIEQFQNLPSISIPRGVGHGDGLFLAGGTNGRLASSSDGVTWTLRTIPGTRNIQGATYGNSTYVIVGTDAYVASSSDGITWTQRSVPGYSSTLFDVTFADGLFVAVGSSYVATSPDGITWTSRTIPSGTYRAVTYGNSLYLATGDNFIVSTSPDGITWTETTTTNTSLDMYAATFGDGLFVIAGKNPYVATSPDGIVWTQRTIDFTDPNADIWTLAFGNGTYLLGANNILFSSSDAITWTEIANPNSVFHYGATFGDDKFVFAGNSDYVTVGAFTSATQYLILEKTELTDLT